jgi:hypothetical protein
VVLAAGQKIEAVDYDAIAIAVNTVFSDTSNGSGGPAVLTCSTSDQILFTPALATGVGEIFTVTSSIEASDYIAVDVNGVPLIGSDVTFDYINNQFTVNISITAGHNVRAYRRTLHIKGWGQTPASVYPHPTYPTDPFAESKILEANINNLIDKTNVMTTRIGSTVELTRIAQGAKIFASDQTTITDTIDNEVTNGNQFDNVVATVTNVAAQISRSTDWSNKLTATAEYRFSSYNQARYFFNAGNELRMSLEMTGDVADVGFVHWDQVVRQMGALQLQWDTTTQTGYEAGTSEEIGFYRLTDAFQTIFTSSSPLGTYDGDGAAPGEYPTVPAAPGEYSNLFLLFEARYREESGQHIVDIRVTLDDSAFVAQDIAGTITLNAGYKAGDDVTDNSASYTTTLPTVGFVDTLIDVDDT